MTDGLTRHPPKRNRLRLIARPRACGPICTSQSRQKLRVLWASIRSLIGSLSQSRTIFTEMSRAGTHVEPLTESPRRDHCSNTRRFLRLKHGHHLPHQHRHQRTITDLIWIETPNRPTSNPGPVAEACRHSTRMGSLHLPPSTKPSLSPPPMTHSSPPPPLL